MNRTEKILEVKNLSVSFNGDSVIENLNFDVQRGDNVAIIGPNGSGKTVLFRALLGTLPYKGEINWMKGARIGYMPQHLHIDKSLPITLREFLQAKLEVSNESEMVLKDIMSTVKLSEEVLDNPLGKLSGGEFQKALITFALIGNPDVILFDEPTASIDAPSEEQIFDTLHELQDIKNITIVIISHDLSLVNRHSNKVLCLNKQQVCFGEPIDTLTTQNLQKLYGGPSKYYHHIHTEERKHSPKTDTK